MTTLSDGNKQKKTLARRLVPLAVLIAGIVIARILAGGPPTPKAETAPATPAQHAVYRLISPQQLPTVVSTYGKLDTRRTLELAAEVSGKIIATSDAYMVGNTVAANQLLLSIDDIDAKTELARAQARLAEAEEQLANERGRGRQAKREWRDLGSDEANALFLREPQSHRVELAVAAAKAELRLAQRNIERLQIRAPFNAVIKSISADLGDYVNKATVVASLLDTSTLEVHLPLSPKQYRSLNFSPEDFAQGVPVMLHREQDSLAAKIYRTAAVVDSDTRLYTAIATIDPAANTKGWRIGEFLRADIPGTRSQAMLAVPPEAIYEQRFIRLINADNTLAMLPIEISHSDESAVYVKSKTAALAEPLRVIVSGLAVSAPGTPLLPIADSTMDSAATQMPKPVLAPAPPPSASASTTLNGVAEH
ncbi:efflux RND transporter periplasmic adaptor subunit [Zhongshania borealis]|uniref:Efflux RND transporter periplasmic adaptor subunit n=1 Tax=Zhongshania borealis TaxID=889488 RepID=A0ABP7WWN8_9GAMM